MKKFEYKTGCDCSVMDLNDLGSEGWELVAVLDNMCKGNYRPVFYFKREIPQ